jgi:hypothetical protein
MLENSFTQLLEGFKINYYINAYIKAIPYGIAFFVSNKYDLEKT